MIEYPNVNFKITYPFSKINPLLFLTRRNNMEYLLS